MSLFPDGRVCQRCGGPMEVHVDLHCQRCGWKPGDPATSTTYRDPFVLYDGRPVSARDVIMLQALGEAGRISAEDDELRRELRTRYLRNLLGEEDDRGEEEGEEEARPEAEDVVRGAANLPNLSDVQRDGPDLGEAR